MIKASLAIIEILKDEGKRDVVIIIFVIILILPLLLISMIYHVISMPFNSIKDYFTDEELEIVQELQEDYGYLQLLDENSNDYLENADIDYSGITFIDETTSIEVFYFNQLDSRWKDSMYGEKYMIDGELTYDKIGTHACGPTSLSIVISTFKQKNYDPVYMSKLATERGHWCAGQGSYHSLMNDIPEYFGLEVTHSNKGSEIVKALQEKKLVIAIMGNGHFTTSGHFIVLRGVTKEGKILVADPVSQRKSEQEWDLSIILNEVKTHGDTPFWIVSNPNIDKDIYEEVKRESEKH